MTEKLYRWVKCCERMPVYKNVPGTRPLIIIRDINHHVDEYYMDEEGFFDNSGEFLRRPDCKKWEWLEELPQVEPSGDEVERVARVICRSDRVNPDIGYAPSGGEPIRLNWEDYVDAAKAAIAAMTPRPKAEGEGVDIEAGTDAISKALAYHHWITHDDCEEASKACAAAWGRKSKEPKE